LQAAFEQQFVQLQPSLRAVQPVHAQALPPAQHLHLVAGMMSVWFVEFFEQVFKNQW